MERLRLTLSCNEYDRTRFLVDGTVQAEGIDLNVVSLPSEERHRRFSRDLEFDVCELQMGVFLGWMGRGAPFTAIPVFPHRKFCHGNVLLNTASGIQQARGSCRQDYRHAGPLQSGIALDAWRAPGGIRRGGAIAQNSDESAGASARMAAAGLDGNSASTEGTKSRRWFDVRGEIDACMLPEINPKLARHTPGVQRLWPNFREVEKDYYLRTKIFPIRHVVVVKNSILERHPWAAQSLVEAFTKAKELGIKHVSDTRRSFLAWYGAELEEERELFGEDAWPYNIKDNRVVLETMTRYAALVGVTDRKLEIKELFAESTFADEAV